MEITSPAFENNGQIPKKYGRSYDDISPPLVFSNIPPDTKSLVLIMDDPDAPGRTYTHWIIYNIPPAELKLAENETPQDASEGINDYGEPSYGGPMPPSGTHRYFFKLYALDSKLNLPEDVNSEKLQQAMEGHVITKAELIGLYSAS